MFVLVNLQEIVGKVIEYRTSPSNIDKAKIIKVGDMKDGLLEGRVRYLIERHRVLWIMKFNEIFGLLAFLLQKHATQ